MHVSDDDDWNLDWSGVGCGNRFLYFLVVCPFSNRDDSSCQYLLTPTTVTIIDVMQRLLLCLSNFNNS